MKQGIYLIKNHDSTQPCPATAQALDERDGRGANNI